MLQPVGCDPRLLLILGLLASTVFTLFVIPVTYWLLYANKPWHGMPVEEAEA